MTPLHWISAAACALGLTFGAQWLTPEPAKPPTARDTEAALPPWLQVLPNSAAPGGDEPVISPATAPATAVALPPAPEAPTAPATPPATNTTSAAAGLSVQVAPGVHVTPLSVPAGTVPEPAGPRPGDSEPEEN